MGLRSSIVFVALLGLAKPAFSAAYRSSLPETDKQDLVSAELWEEPTIGLSDSGNCSEAELQPTIIRAGGSIVVQFSITEFFRVRGWEAMMVNSKTNLKKILKGSYYADELRAGYYSLRIPSGDSLCKDCELKLVIVGQDSSSLRYCAPVSVISARNQNH